MNLDTLAHELEQRVDKTHPDGCWIWLRGTNRGGYGWLQAGRSRMLAHRLAFFLAHGYLPAVVRHTCDTPRCVNPDHLLAGTQAENARDAMERGRTTRGERHTHSKVTSDDVREIRRRYAAGGITQADLGAEYGLKQPTVSNILAGRFWGWLK